MPSVEPHDLWEAVTVQKIKHEVVARSVDSLTEKEVCVFKLQNNNIRMSRFFDF